MRGCQILLATKMSQRNPIDPQLQLELALIRLADARSLLDVDGVMRKIERLEKQASQLSAGGIAPGPR